MKITCEKANLGGNIVFRQIRKELHIYHLKIG